MHEVDAFQKKVGWSKEAKVIGLHIRGSDSCAEARSTKRVCDKLDDVIPDLQRIRQKYGIANVFVATDDLGALLRGVQRYRVMMTDGGAVAPLA